MRDLAEKGSGDPKMPRRKFLGLMLGATVGGALARGGVELANEERGMLWTNWGNFFVNYQNHELGNTEGQIPNKIIFDAFAPENASTERAINDDPNVVLNASSSVRKEMFDKGVIGRLTRESEVDFISADVGLPPELLVMSLSIESLETLGALIYFTKYGLYESLKKLIGQVDESGKDSQKDAKGVSRRIILKRLGGVVAAWAATRFAQPIAFLSYTGNMDDIGRTPSNRAALKISGAESILHPEDLVIFFRNLIMAYKTLKYCERFKEDHGRWPNVYMEIGAAHSGIEHLLEWGPDVCLQMLKAYPKLLLQNIAKGDAVGGARNAATTRSIVLPKGYKKDSSLTRRSDELFVDEALLEIFK